MNPPKTIEIPSRRFGVYHVRSRLGVGGMAEVFLAEAQEPGVLSLTQVALKLMREGQDAEAFAAEADLMGLLDHPNLVRRLEVGEAFGRLYIAMEALLGGDLLTLVEAHRADGRDFPHHIAVHVTLEVLKGLASFHQARTRSGAPLALVHGDINPANIFFGEHGEVKLGDFGVATSRRAAMGPPEGVAAGKLRYLSPEQARGDALTPASDVFTVGVMLYELVTGRHPFLGDAMEQKVALAAIRAAKIAIPDSLPRLLANALRRALAVDVRERTASAAELAGHLFHYAVDHELVLQPAEVRTWLESQSALLY